MSEAENAKKRFSLSPTLYNEVSLVDNGAGEDVDVVLFKRDTKGSSTRAKHGIKNEHQAERLQIGTRLKIPKNGKKKSSDSNKKKIGKKGKSAHLKSKKPDVQRLLSLNKVEKSELLSQWLGRNT